MRCFGEIRQGNGEGEMQGSLHCAMDGEAAHRFGRDGGWWRFGDVRLEERQAELAG
jgi:hypothetical protein